MQQLSNLSDDVLLRGLHLIVGSHRRATAELILHLGEVDARRLHLEKGFSSLFTYCVEKLCFSEDEACRRIECAGLARKFPVIHALLEAGSLSLTVLSLLKPHLTEGNHRELLEGVSGSSSRQAKEWLAVRFPLPDVPSSIRKLPERRSLAVTVSLSAPPTAPRIGNLQEGALDTRAPAAPRIENAQDPAVPIEQDRDVAGLALEARAPVAPRVDSGHDVADHAVGTGSALGAAPPMLRRAALARIGPLSRDRFLVKFTASRGLRDKLELARDLMSHANPEGELAVVLERAVDLLIAQLEKRKLGRASQPRKGPAPAPSAGSTEPRPMKDAAPPPSAGSTEPRPMKDAQVTRAARREVVARDGFRCSFVADDGQRCGARAFVEFDHVIPKGRGGGSHAGNIRPLCRAHNCAAAERAYGTAHVSRAIARTRSKVGKPLVVRESIARYRRERDAPPEI